MCLVFVTVKKTLQPRESYLTQRSWKLWVLWRSLGDCEYLFFCCNISLTLCMQGIKLGGNGGLDYKYNKDQLEVMQCSNHLQVETENSFNQQLVCMYLVLAGWATASLGLRASSTSWRKESTLTAATGEALSSSCHCGQYWLWVQKFATALYTSMWGISTVVWRLS